MPPALSPSHSALWIATLRGWVPLDEADIRLIEPHLSTLSLARGEHLLAAGERAERVGMVASGVLRESFPLADGTERTRAFAATGDLVGSLSDLLSGLPARTDIVAEVDAIVLTVPWSVVVGATAARPAWRELLGCVTERLYLAKAEREYELLALDAETRYARFRQKHPTLESRVAQRHVASYLGITPEHLSRIRARQRRAKRAV